MVAQVLTICTSEIALDEASVQDLFAAAHRFPRSFYLHHSCVLLAEAPVPGQLPGGLPPLGLLLDCRAPRRVRSPSYLRRAKPEWPWQTS